MADSTPRPSPLPPHLLTRADVRDALARHDLGRLFHLVRKWGGISYLRIADVCGIKPERVGRLARGEGRVTSYDKIAAVADGLRIPGHLLGLAPRPWEDEPPHAATLPPPPPGHGLVDRLRERTARLRRLDDYLGGAETYPLYAAELRWTTALARDDARPALLAVVAEQAQQAGWAAFDAGYLTEAERLYRTAMHAATEANDRPLAANSLALLAQQQASAADRPPGRSGVEAATAACEVAGDDAPPAVRTLLHSRRAWVHARAGDETETRAALAAAEEAFAQRAAADPGPDWATWVDRTELDLMTGRCWTELGRPHRAIPLLERALAAFPDTQARNKSLHLSWLAHAYLDADDPTRAATATCRTLELAYGVGSIRPYDRVRILMARLRRRAGRPPTRAAPTPRGCPSART